MAKRKAASLLVGKAETIASPQLRERGWTDALIKRFLPAPDATRTNTHYKSGPPMRLYLLDRVARIEATPKFQSALAVSKPWKEAASRAVATKKAALMAAIDALPPPNLPEIDEDELTRRAIQHYNNDQLAFAEERGRDEPKTANADASPDFLDRITVNYVRHQLTGYEKHLETTARRVGKKEGYLVIKKRILDAIAAAYPWLKSECYNQEMRMEATYW